MFEIAIATNAELALRAAEVRPGPAKDVLDDWRAIVIRPEIANDDVAILSMHLVGTARSRGRLVCTSQVMALDTSHGRVRTLNGSLYLLGDADDTPLPTSVLLGLVNHFLGGP